MNLSDQQKIRLGACGWNLDEWRGTFYPPDLPQDRWLEFYARYFPAVEVDATSGGAPPEEVVQHWIDSTPASFRFACKLPRAITHACRLRDCSPDFNRFVRAVEPLGAKLHVILVQLPPSFAPDDGKAALRSFVEQLPRDFRFAIEFRHAGWHKPQIIHLLEKHRVCWVWADSSPLSERNLAPFELWPNTADFLYLRFLGDYTTKPGASGEGAHPYGKLLWKREAALDSWALKIDRHLQESRSVWGFVHDHFEGFAPETCQRLAQRLGFDLPLPTSAEAVNADPGQLELFGVDAAPP